MKTTEIPRWIKLTGAILPIVVALFAVGSWANEKWMAQTFMTIAEAAEHNTALINRIENSGKAAEKDNIEMRLQIIAVEINWLVSLENRTVYHDERLALLRTQQRILMEQYAALSR